jgi:hypothetical protein
MSAMAARSAASLLLCFACALCAWTRPARADGAFPDSLGILLPRDQPDRIIAATNFGLLRSDDGGASFGLICEEVVGTLASLYQVGPPPDDHLYAVTIQGVSQSKDGACSWDLSEGLPIDMFDVFPDPHDPKHVLAIGKADPTDSGAPRKAVFESDDGGENFAVDPIYLGPGGADLTGVEIARSDPNTIFVAQYAYAPPPVTPSLSRSRDGGKSFDTIDLGARLGTKLIRILAIDPDNADKVYLRIFDNGVEEQLGVYDAASDELTIGLRTEYTMSAFLRRSDGTLLLGTKEGPAFISEDGGASFKPWPDKPHFRALGERGGVLYAVTDNKLDGYAVGVSHDNGDHFEPLVTFAQLTGPLACGDVPQRCAIPWDNFQRALQASSEPDVPPGEGDGGLDSDAGGGSPHKRPSGKRASGCGCAVIATGTAELELWPWLALALGLGSVLRVRRRAAARARSRVKPLESSASNE